MERGAFFYTLSLFFKEDDLYTTVPEAEATRGQRSAHSLPTGPVMAEPFISPLGLTMTPALSAILFIF